MYKKIMFLLVVISFLIICFTAKDPEWFWISPAFFLGGLCALVELGKSSLPKKDIENGQD